MYVPVYEYKCRKCEATFEELVRSESADRVACPKCGGSGAERQPSVFAAHAAAQRPSSRPPGCDQCCKPDGSCPFSQ